MKHKSDLYTLASIKNAKVQQGKSYKAIAALKSVADEVGITKALSNSKEGILEYIGGREFQN